MEQMIGKMIGQLKVVSRLGKGGMGEVYLVEHMLLNKRFAVKVLSPQLTSDPEFSERFYHEATNQALLNHPNIVDVTDFIKQDEQYFMVMEYVDGHNVDELIKEKGRLSEQEALTILKEVLEGLGFAHSKGLIHRDMKPSNIRVDSSGHVKILDFGVAIMAGEKRLTGTGRNVGTVWYMSPEQIERPKEIDLRSDVYSLGIVLFEMVTGDVPYHADSDFGVLQQQIRAPIPNPREKNPEISPQLSQIIVKALAKRPEDRFQSCQEFLQEVERIRPPEPTEPAHPRSKLLLAVIAAAVLLLITVLYFLFRTPQPSPVPTPVPPPPVQTPTEPPPVQPPTEPPPVQSTPEPPPPVQKPPAPQKQEGYTRAERQAFLILIQSALNEGAIICREKDRLGPMRKIRDLARDSYNQAEADLYSKRIEEINDNINDGIARYNSILAQLALNHKLAEQEFEEYGKTLQGEKKPRKATLLRLMRGHYRQYAKEYNEVEADAFREFCLAR